MAITQKEISQVLPGYFLTYATEVIQERAIPRIEDGLKPVQRRIVWSMYETGNSSSKPVVKCARTVGNVLAKYHAHGDSSVYDAMVQISQPFSMRYPLIDFVGNVGTQSGKPAAAYRYTNARLSQVGECMLEDINKNTVDMQNNFDDTCQEPIALGGYFPNQLVNPCDGIAVGIATTFAPHYLKDVIAAAHLVLQNMIEDKGTTVDDLIRIVKAPDFPTGGTIVNASEMPNIYKTGRGRVILQAKYEIKDNQIIFYEIPYKINYDSLMTSLVQAAEKIPDIKDIRDESSKSIRIIVEIKKNAEPGYIVRQLLKNTELRSNFNCNFVAIGEDNKPKQNITLEDLFSAYLTRAAKTLYRALEYDKSKYEKRISIIDALLLVIHNVDKVTHILRTTDEPLQELQKTFSIDEAAANVICDTKFRTISKLSENKLVQEKADLEKQVQNIQHIFSDQKVFLKKLQEKLDAIPEMKCFAKDTRKTDLMDLNISVDERDMIKDEQVVLTYTNHDIIKSVRVSEYQGTKNAGKGTMTKLKEDEVVIDMLTLNTRDELFAFTNTGRCHALPVYKIPIVKTTQLGKYLSTFLNLNTGEHVIHIMSAKPEDLQDKSFLLTTQKGIVKRLNTSELAKRGTITRCITLSEDDSLASVLLCKYTDSVVLISSENKAIKINLNDARRPVNAQGRTAKGVRGMSVKDEAHIIASVVVADDKFFVTVDTRGNVKRMTFDMIPLNLRGSAGVLLCSNKNKTELVAAVQASANQDLIIATKNGKVAKMSIDHFPVHGRTARGNKGIKLDDDDIVVSADIASIEETEGN